MQLNTADESHTKAMRPVRDTTMLSFLRRPLTNAVTLRAFRNIRESTTAEKRRCEQRSATEMELVKAKISSQITENQFTCASRLTENSQIIPRIPCRYCTNFHATPGVTTGVTTVKRLVSCSFKDAGDSS